MSGIHLMLLGGSSRATTGPSIANLAYAPYSNNIDTVVETSRISFDNTYGTESSFLLESNNTLIRPYSRNGNFVNRFNPVGSVADTTLNSGRALPTFSNYKSLWTTQSPDPQYQFVSYYNSTASRTYIGRVALTGTTYTANGELWTGTETPADIAVPTSQYAFVLRTTGELQRRTMGTAWGLNFISTQIWNSPYTTGTRRISFSPTGDKLYIAVGTIVYEHVMGVPYDLTTISGSALRSATVTSSNFQLQGGYYGLANAGNFTFYQYILGSKQVSGITYPGGAAPLFNDAGYVAPNGTDVFLMYRSTVSSVVTQFVQKITLGSSYNPSTITVSQQALVSTGSAQVTGVFFKSDGTKAFFLRQSDVLAFNLSTAWDLSTMTSDTSYAFTLTFLPQGIWFSTDGTKFFVSDTTFDAVFQYDLSVAWDISTAAQGSQIFFSGLTTLVGGISFNSSGSVMYLCTGQGRKVLQFDLTVPWNIATAVFVRSREMGMVGIITNQLSINSPQNKALVISKSSLSDPILSAFDI
jgi:hypothetical protein